MTFSYSAQAPEYPNTVSLLKNKNIKIKGFSSLYFYARANATKTNKNISKKESFYQYLFIQQIFNNSSTLNNQFDVKISAFSLYKSPLKVFLNLAQDTAPSAELKTSLILENLKNPASAQAIVGGKKNYLNKNKIGTGYPKLFLQDKIFITYKKSFLCYWLLPFLGLVSSFPTLLQSSLAFPLDNNGIALHTEINQIGNSKFLKRRETWLPPSPEPSLKRMLSSDTMSASFKQNSYDNLNSLLQAGKTGESLKKEYSVLLYARDTYKDKKNIAYSNKNINQQPLESLLLTALNLYKDTHLEQSLNSALRTNFKKPVKEINKAKDILGSLSSKESQGFLEKRTLADFSFALLNRSLKSRSNFKWYWFDLFLNKNSSLIDSSFPNKISNCAFAKAKARLDSDHILYGRNLDVDTPFFKKTFLSSSYARREASNNNLGAPKGINSISLDRSIKNNPQELEQKPDNIFLKNKNTYSSTLQKMAHARKPTFSIKGEDVTQAEHHHLPSGDTTAIGIIKNDLTLLSSSYARKQASSVSSQIKTQNTGHLNKETEIKSTSMNPYKSIKKAFFLMDVAQSRNVLNSDLLSSHWIKEPQNYAQALQTVKKYNSLLSSTYAKRKASISRDFSSKKEHFITQALQANKNVKADHLNEALQKTILLILKNKSSYQGAKRDEALHQIPNNKNKNQQNIDGLIKKDKDYAVITRALSVSPDSIININKSDLLYNCIFEGLKSSLNQILDNKTNKVKSYPFNKALHVREHEISTNRAAGFANVAFMGSSDLLLKNKIDLSSKSLLCSLTKAKARLDYAHITYGPNLGDNFKLKKKLALAKFLNHNLLSSSVARREASINKNNSKFSTDYYGLTSDANIFTSKFATPSTKPYFYYKGFTLPKNNTITSNISVLTLSNSIRGGNLSLSAFASEKLQKTKFKKLENSFKTNNYHNKEALFNITKKQTQISISKQTQFLPNVAKDASKVNNASSHLSNILIKNITKHPQHSPKGSSSFMSNAKALQANKDQMLNKNSYLFLSKYIGLITNKIKTSLSPYKLRLTYLPEVNILKSKLAWKSYNKQDRAGYGSTVADVNFIKSSRGVNAPQVALENKQNFSSKFEKMFLSYLSKAKKAKNTKKNKEVSLLPKGKLHLLQNLKLKSKVKLKNISKLTHKHYKWFKALKGQTPVANKNISPLMLLKNRLFINKEVEAHLSGLSDKSNKPFNSYLKGYLFNPGDTRTSSAEHVTSREGLQLSPTEGVAFGSAKGRASRLKKQHLKVKRRLKKMKKETRRRKKRKIFYPRPTWITFSIYKKFLSRFARNSKTYSPAYKFIGGAKARPDFAVGRNLKVLKSVLNAPTQPAFGQAKQKNINTNSISFVRKSAVGTSARQPLYSFWLSNKRYKNYTNKEALFKNTKDFYKISRTVFGDLKRVLMKSNWLRSYLNPYLEKVKNIYKEMQKSSQKMHVYTNLRSFILFIYGSLKEPPFLNQIRYNYNTESFKPLDSFPMYLNVKNSLSSPALFISREQAQNYNHTSNGFTAAYLGMRGLKNGSDDSLINNKALFKSFYSSPLDGQSLSNKSNKHSINLLEYNRIIYQRIQRVILNIRENLNLNGQLKNRSKKLGKNIRSFIKREYAKRDPNNAQPSNQNGAISGKLIKNTVLKFGKMFSYGYEDSSPYQQSWQSFSRNNLYWAVNKSSTLVNANFSRSAPKKLWETYKIREISKSNKTKKMIFNIFMKYNSAFKPTNSLDGYSHILKRNTSNITFLKSLNFDKDSYSLESVATPSGVEALQLAPPINLKAESKATPTVGLNEKPFTLPANLYTVKSEQKLINVENKLKLLGLDSKSKSTTYKNAYFRFLKQQLLKEKSFYIPYSNKNSNINVLERANTTSLSSSIARREYRFFNIKQKSINNMSGTNLFKSHYSSFNNYAKMSNNYSYWWSSFKELRLSFFLTNKTLKSTVTQNAIADVSFDFLAPATLSSFLFHFCALVSFISLGGVRTLIKFYYILISKLSKLISKGRLVNLFPKSKTFGKDLQLNNSSLLSSSVARRESSVGKTLLNAQRDKDFNNKETKTKITQSVKLMLMSQKSPPHIGISNFKDIKLSFFKYLTARSTKARLRLTASISSEDTKNGSPPSVLLSAPFSAGLEEGFVNSMGWTILKKKNSKFLVSKKPELARAEFYNILTALRVSLLLFVKKFLNRAARLNKSTAHERENKMTRDRYKIMYYSFLKLSIISRFAHKASFCTYLLLLKSVDLFAAPASFIYKFFEKPGEYVVENLAYSFLVEWSADLISTIPDTVDINTYSYFSKINKSFTALMLTNMGLSFQLRNSLLNTFNFSSLELGKNNDISSSAFGGAVSNIVGAAKPFLFGLSNSALRRLLNSTFLVFIQQLCEPDLDHINRQKKGIIFWDIWGEYLKKVAEENSINIYELTTDKEEQIKLLSKYEETLLNNVNPNTVGDYSVLETNNYLYSKHSLYNLNTKNSSHISIKKRLDKSFNKIKKLSFFSFKEREASLNKNNFTANSRENVSKSKGLISFVNPKNTNNNYYNWSVSQFLSYQGKDTDLFIDLHPPKTFSSSAASLKYSYSVQQPIGSIVCQIYSGIFYKQISKNILVVGSSGLEKSLLIQAIAGETELKIITDNAHRYAMVYRGVAVGIKLLRDVFEALSVHTPCIFLMEDIHAIGERRPFLIDEASSNSTESTYNKNQSMQGLFLKEKSSASREVLYKSNKHLLSHYKKPYKEPRGLATNHFSFTFLFGDVFAKVRNNEIRPGGAALPIQVIKKEYQQKHLSMAKSQNNNSSLKDQSKSNKSKIYDSSLLIKPSKDELLSPPSSSPFSVLILKEAAKLKHKKVVKELPWFGLPGEQYSLVSKYNYSIRVKVALLADLVLSNLSVKLDMITDLLVIIDSVKGNRGFVVFATTHVPYILDPALRRPGRFDETISLPLIPALYSRWANYGYNVQYLTTSLFKKYCIPLNYTFNKGTTLDLFNSASLSHTQNNTSRAIDKLINYIYVKNSTLNQKQAKVSKLSFKRLLLAQTETAKPLGSRDYLNKKIKSSWKHLTPLLRNYASPSTSAKKNKTISAERYSLSLNNNFSVNSTSKYSSSLKNFKEKKSVSFFSSSADKNRQQDSFSEKTYINTHKKITNKQALQFKSKHYSNACRSLISLMLYTYSNNSKEDLLKNKSLSFSLKWPSMLKDSNVALEDYSVYLSLFGYPLMLKTILMSLIGGKLGESFAISSNLKRNEHLSNKSGALALNNAALFNFDKTWKYGSSLLFSYIQKRQCSALNKNLALCSTKLLSFNNKYSLMEAPSPPISNILLPAKRYDNYKRTFNNQYGTPTSQNNFGASVTDKIQLHQQQRLLKRLYKYPIKEFFRSEILNSNKTFCFSKKLENQTSPKVKSDVLISNFSSFNNSFPILAPLEKTNLASLNKLSSVNWCYRNILYNRHRTYLTNQWWNGQQGEHNAETTFLSDIDWRYTFVQSIGDIHIDFPDSEQFYNPRNRRWMLTNGDWNYWFNIQAELKDIYSHYVYECFTKAYKYLDQNREIIDFYAETLHQAPLATDLKERDILNLYKRFFYKT